MEVQRNTENVLNLNLNDDSTYKRYLCTRDFGFILSFEKNVSTAYSALT